MLRRSRAQPRAATAAGASRSKTSLASCFVSCSACSGLLILTRSEKKHAAVLQVRSKTSLASCFVSCSACSCLLILTRSEKKHAAVLQVHFRVPCACDEHAPIVPAASGTHGDSRLPKRTQTVVSTVTVPKKARYSWHPIESGPGGGLQEQLEPTSIVQVYTTSSASSRMIPAPRHVCARLQLEADTWVQTHYS